jgi:hypothetical protein
MSSNATGTPPTAVIRASIKRAWLSTPVIAAIMLTGCATHHPVTADVRPAPTDRVSCPPGTHQRGGDCLNNGTAEPANPLPDGSPTCPQGTHLRAGECLHNVHLTRANDY